MAEIITNDVNVDKSTVKTWVDFLQEQPPGSIVSVSEDASRNLKGLKLIATPDLQLFCPESTCNSNTFFFSEESHAMLMKEQWVNTFLTYRCRNCLKYCKTFAVALHQKNTNVLTAFKFGEYPAYGPTIPARVLRLIQPDRELFLSGRRCENQGLGIGAFTYYRRAVENQWARLVDEIIKVAITIDAPETTLAVLETSRDETQFSKSIKDVKHAIPPSLLIKGQNPLALLHTALSKGVHSLTDGECLSLAITIRLILIELSEKLGQALKNDKELTDAVSRLVQVQSAKTTKKACD